MKPATDDRRGQRGSQVVELAIALPVLLLLTFLVTEVAALVRVHQVINNAAREGARVAVLQVNSDDPTTPAVAAAQSYVQTYVPAACTPNPPTVAVQQVSMLTAGGITMLGQQVTVTCSYQWAGVKGDLFPWFNIPATVPLKGQATFSNLH